MIILNGKRLGFIALLVFSAVFVFTFQKANLPETVQTVTLPVSGKVIILDAGHGKPDEGAESSSGTTEAETNLKITLKVQSLLEQSGSTVILTRSDENGIYDLDKTTLREKKISDVRNSFFYKEFNLEKEEVDAIESMWVAPKYKCKVGEYYGI